MELSYVICALVPLEFRLTVSLSIAQLMVTNYRRFVRWKRCCLEMFRTCYLVYPVVRWCYQGVFAGLQIQS